ncbi:helix-turn-helix domain-containing protein [Bacillus pumilus]|uniref:helix-turn-helix domain-containing protein n=1 Tax=Bacillus pumilus TaxID=1408 RepID=UPI002281E8CF|nr:helix-turn-helix transcriptional regulator [Bacillus pumilus]MCY7500086.1 helix-turn-helix transcriptional regulator [Bacillus pumilus]MCY7528590.1 helix-turn-helix transcriptional regulator [Bacillus pumilus]MED4439450.1 helix-turn-helix transcriptional regulator [Bacillus pumilus]MED4489893.1 helix-turn-helix transcriptional regulator [Bacillus pumilus]
MSTTLNYKPLKIKMVIKGITPSDLKKDLGLAPATVVKLNKNEYVALTVIHKICDYMDCAIQEVVEFVREES